jgi:4-amino-4-deoxy-L-arabinose transferase-like glycosyltransferase
MSREHRPIILLLLAFILLGFAYSAINPLHEATDELRHYRFVQHIIQRQSLPVQGAMACSAQGHHPPLYYALAAAATGWIDAGRDVCYEPPTNPFWAHHYWEVGVDNKNQYLHGPEEAFPWSGEALAAHLARLVNVLIGAAVVWVTWAIGRTIWPTRPYLAFGGAAIVAFNPMFLYMAAAINNDIIAALAGAAVTLGSVKLMRDEVGLRPHWGLILGALYGLALLSKFNLAAIIVTIELAVTWVAWRKNQWRQWLVVNLLIVAVTAVLAGWWFARNQMLYGEPTGIQRLTELWGVRNPADSLGVALFELPYVWTSLWGRFGYGQIPLPQVYYLALGAGAIIAAAGLLLPIMRRDSAELRAYGPYLLLLLANVALFFAVIFNYLLVSPAGPMGRFFFPALPSLALLLFYGLSQWLALLPAAGDAQHHRRAARGLTAVVTLAMAGFSLVALFGYIAPAYARPASFAADASLPHPVDASFGGFVALRGYEIGAQTVTPGGDVDVTFYWEVIATPPGDYLQFVHLIDEQGFMIAQRDTHPGLGRFPSSQWQAGARFVDVVRLTIPDIAYAPALGTLSTGFYAPGEGYRLEVTAVDGQTLGDALPLDQVAIVAAAGANGQDIPNLTNQNFAGELLLQGYAYDQRQVVAGQPVGVTLYWQALGDERADYEVQLRLLDEQGWIMETVQERPLSGQSPTNTWRRGDLIAGRHEIPTQSSLPPGLYRVQIALQDAATGERAVILAPDGHWIDDKLQLAELRVLPP